MISIPKQILLQDYLGQIISNNSVQETRLYKSPHYEIFSFSYCSKTGAINWKFSKFSTEQT